MSLTLLVSCTGAGNPAAELTYTGLRPLSVHVTPGRDPGAAIVTRGAQKLHFDPVRVLLLDGGDGSDGESVRIEMEEVEDHTLRWRLLVSGGEQGRVFSGLHLRYRLSASSAPQQPRWTQFGYAKYAAAGVVDILKPLPAHAAGGIFDGLESVEGEPLTQGVAVDPQIGWWTGVVRYGDALPLVGLSACSAQRFKTRMAVGVPGEGVEGGLAWAVEIGSPADPVHIPAGTELTLDSLCLTAGNHLEEVDAQLAAALKTGYDPRPRPEPANAPRMFSTWHADFAKVSIASIQGHLEALANAGYLNEQGLLDFQIDDGYQLNWGDWLATHPSFGGTLTDAVAAIRARGLRPGLWLAPGVVAAASKVAVEHPEWLLRRSDGALVVCGLCSMNHRQLYVLDWSIPEVGVWMADVLRELRTIGFESFKVDFLAVAAVETSLAAVTSTTLERYHHMLAALREGAPAPTVLWSATYPLLPTFGALDGYRVAADLGFAFLPDLPPVNRMHYLRALAVRGAWFAQFGLIDPDAFFAKAQPSPAARQSLAVLDAMSGGYYAVGDKPSDLAGELNPATLPPELQEVLGTGIPFAAARPFDYAQARWFPFSVMEELLGAGGFTEGQDNLYFRPLDSERTLLVLVNWGKLPFPVRQEFDLRPILERIAQPGDRFSVRTLNGYPPVSIATESRIAVRLEGLGASVAEIRQLP